MAQPAAQQSARRRSDVLRCCHAYDSVGLVLFGKPSRDRLAGCRDVPIWQSVLRQAIPRAGSRGVGCVLGRIRQRALTRSLVSPRIYVELYRGAGLAGYTGLGTDGSGSTCSFGSVGMTWAPTARAASPVEL